MQNSEDRAPMSKILTTARSNSLSLHQEDYKFRTNTGLPPLHPHEPAQTPTAAIATKRKRSMASCKLVALLFALAAVASATAVQPSEARIQGLERRQDAGGDQMLRPSTFHITAPPPRSPGVVPLPPQPATGSAPPPPPPPLTECMTPLIGMVPCMDYLTNLTVLTPPAACCDGLKAVIRGAPICLCHGMNGGMNSLMPRPIDPLRMVVLPLTCGAMLPLETLLSCNTQHVPPIMPPMPAPATADAPAASP
ncbi:hypothetical protein GQ55_4G295000 [Panicum hallii var. hallii]|uniref:Bifunctional inhibitor/plant lipid transfer protein/seed storage helical domain-containing protein n=1 Tax=Panicum hallii var. hallii TaxID=1504633 RepID=A0A2T7E1I2_9POAL|nr:hypothetical protein GQ55_4G295000 [Panicum hallii var. hallii]